MNEIDFKHDAGTAVYPDVLPGSATLTRLCEALAAWFRANRLTLARVIVLFLTVRVALSIVGFLAMHMIPENRIAIAEHRSANIWIDMWVRWDATHYLDVAEQWYDPSSKDIAFFPLLPFLMEKAAFLTGGDYIYAGLLVASFAFVAGLFYLYKLVELEFDAELAARTVLYLAIAPMAFFFLSIYTEPLFLALSVAAIYHARQKQWLVAAGLGALACLCRPPGILVIVPLGYEFIRQWRAGERPSLFAPPLLLALPTALGGWMYYIADLTSDPNAFFKAQGAEPWHRRSDLPWHTLQDAWKALLQSKPHTFEHAQFMVDFAAAMFLVITAILCFRYLPRMYALYLAASVVFLLTSRSDIQVLFSMPRFALVQFPAFILLAKAGRNQFVHQFVLTAFTALLGFYTALFVSWYWIA